MIFFSAGFFVGSIVQQFGPSRCGVVGNVLFSFGFVASFFSSSTAFLVVTCGVISGKYIGLDTKISFYIHIFKMAARIRNGHQNIL